MPSTSDLTAEQVMDGSAALLNDTAQSVYTDTIQIPYLNLALDELQEIFQLNNIPATDEQSAVINVPSGFTAIKFNVTNGPQLPSDLVEPLKLWEREEDTDPFVPMTRVNSFPHELEGNEITQFQWYKWEAQEIRFLEANRDNDIKMDYTRRLFVPIVVKENPINIINAKTFLEYRTAGLCAEFIGENKTRASDLNVFASLAIDRATGIGTKGRQASIVRHRPFRSSYKRRSYM